MNSREYIEVSIRVQPFSEEAAEIVEAFVADLPFDSFVVEDPCLKCYIQASLFEPAALKEALAACGSPSWTSREVQGENWNRTWEQEGFTPISVDGKVWVVPAGSAKVRGGRFHIALLPEMAFGTGHHQTTWLMLYAMLACEGLIRGGRVADLGCGTGVLAILAAKMRAAQVDAIDIDEVAVQSARENARLNRVGSRIAVTCGDASALDGGRYDVILANIHRNIILDVLPRMKAALVSGGAVLLSGFYYADAEAVLEEARRLGLAVEADILTREDPDENPQAWACLVLQSQK